MPARRRRSREKGLIGEHLGPPPPRRRNRIFFVYINRPVIFSGMDQFEGASVTLSPPLSSGRTSRVVTLAESPQPHRGWCSRGYVPHWDHPGMIQSVNFRLNDSLPAHVIEKWKGEIPSGVDRDVELRRRIDKYLDAGHGACWLRRTDIAEVVENTLFHFDGIRYRLLAWCIMPNHVHVLAETQLGFPLADILHSWKSFTSHEINRILSRRGNLWRREYYDRFIRNAEHYDRIVTYIEENPVKAGLARRKTDWPFSSARYRDPGTATASVAGLPLCQSSKYAGGAPAVPGKAADRRTPGTATASVAGLLVNESLKICRRGAGGPR